MEKSPQVCCGYCHWLIATECFNLLEHECFKEYNEDLHYLNIDENYVATIVQKIYNTQDVEVHQSINAEFDERLIVAVMDRPSLYDHRLNVKERSKLKKSALWEEVQKIIGGNMSIKELQERWKYHRDCYIRARRKLKQYVPSGSGASSANSKSSYRFFELMKPLGDTLQTNSTVNTLSSKDKVLSSRENIISSGHISTQNLSPVLLDTENSTNGSIEFSDTLSQVSTSFTNSQTPKTSQTVTPTPPSTKKRALRNKPSELEKAVLDILKVLVLEMDAVDGFLKSLGEHLHRLPYRKRSILEIKYLQMAVEAELEERE